MMYEKREKKGRFAPCRMPQGEQDDAVLYDDRDGRYIDGRADGFPEICLSVMRDAGVLDRVLDARRILDIGAGTGQLVAALSALRPGVEAVGVEPCEAARKIAVPGSVLVEHAEGQFDVTMCWHVLEHVFNPPLFVRDMAAKTKPGGMVIIATPNSASPFAWSKRWRGWIVNHIYVLPRKMTKELMQEAGLRVVSQLTWGGFPAPRPWWQQALNKAAKLFGVADTVFIAAVKETVDEKDNGLIWAMSQV